MAAALHLDIAVHNFGIQEYMQHSATTLEVFRTSYTFADGLLHPGDNPGLGVDLDEEAAARFEYAPAYLPVNRRLDGTVHEYLAGGVAGRIVFVGSVSDRGTTSQTAYSASKGGLRGLARTIAKEYGHRGIRANIVVAGLVDTSLSAGLPERFRQLFMAAPMRRAGTPHEIAAPILYLASPGTRFLNGETLYASGGIAEMNA